jgi:hypothetical protein
VFSNLSPLVKQIIPSRRRLKGVNIELTIQQSGSFLYHILLCRYPDEAKLTYVIDVEEF